MKKIDEILDAPPSLPGSTQSVAVSLYSSSEIASVSSSRSPTPDSTKASRRQASVCSFARDGPIFVYTSPNGTSSAISRALTPLQESPLSKKPSMQFKSPARPHGSRELPRPLVLRLNAIPSPIQVVRVRSSPPFATSDTPILPVTPTPTDTPAVTPITPVFPSPAEMRSKRMAKLARTLGEVIPPYLVPMLEQPATSYECQSSAQHTQSAMASHKRRSMSVDLSGTTNILSLPRSSRVWITGTESWRGEWNRKDIKEVQNQLRSLKCR